GFGQDTVLVGVSFGVTFQGLLEAFVVGRSGRGEGGARVEERPDAGNEQAKTDGSHGVGECGGRDETLHGQVTGRGSLREMPFSSCSSSPVWRGNSRKVKRRSPAWMKGISP